MPYLPTPELAAFVQRLPKTETHLHLEGALPLELLEAAFPGKYSKPPMWADSFRYASFDQFMELFDRYLVAYFTSADRYYEAAKVVLARCRDQNCKYVETSIHLPGVHFIGEKLDTVLAAIREAAPPELELRLFAGMPHDAYSSEMSYLVDQAVESELLDGLDLHAQEYMPMEPWTARIWEAARARGKFNKAHAGEFMPASFVDWVLDHLKVKRIEHGVRSIESPATVQRLIDEGVALDVCPISNVKLAVEGVPSMAQHPIRRLFDAGVKVTVNSDDPFMFGNTLSEDYYALAQDLKFTRRELVQLARNGFDIALWDEAAKKPFYDELDAIEREIAESAA